MTQADIEKKQLVIITYLKKVIKEYTKQDWLIKAEYSTNDKDKQVIVVQEVAGEKVVLYGDTPLYNYYMIDIYGTSIQEEKNISLLLGNLIGHNDIIDIGTNEKWQILTKQFSNPRAIEYQDIRRVGYNMTIQTIVNKIK